MRALLLVLSAAAAVLGPAGPLDAAGSGDPTVVATANSPLADPAAPDRTSGDATDSLETEGAAGLRIWLDPGTGETTSTPSDEQRAAFEALVTEFLEQRASGRAAPRTFRLSNGGTGVYREGGFLSFLTATREATGEVRLHCGDPDHDLAAHPDPGGAETHAPTGAPLR